MVDRALLEPGMAPLICARTGGPADALVEVCYWRVPQWTWILLPFGILPWLIARWCTQEEMTGALPFSQAVIDRYRTLSRSMAIVGVSALAALLIAAWARFAALAWLGIAGLLALVVLLAVRESGTIRGRPEPGLRALRLDGVHPAFVAGVNPLLRV
jgi:hypothetical protein